MNIYILARSFNTQKKFLSNNPHLQNCSKFILGATSFFEEINNIIKHEESPCLILHDDVITPEDFLSNTESTIKILNENYEWGIAGNAGISTVAESNSKCVRFICDPHGSTNSTTDIFPAQSIDGNAILLNTPILRNKVSLPDFKGFQFYDIILSIETIKSGLAVLICPSLYLFHSSKGSQNNWNNFLPKVLPYFRRTLRNSSLTTLNGLIDNSQPAGDVDIVIDSLKVAATKHSKSLALVIRTCGKRNELLERTICSSLSLLVKFKFTKARLYVAYGNNSEITDELKFKLLTIFPNQIEFIFIPTSKPDNRFELIVKAVRKLEEDYIWFVDDDDWLFPNGASLLDYSLNCFIKNKTFFVGSSHFKEKNLENNPYGPVEEQRYFPPQDFIKNFSGDNYTPLPSCIFPRDSLKNLLSDIHLKNITYFEDYFCILSIMLSQNFSVCLLDLLYVGISIREDSDQSVSSLDRTVWDESKLYVFSYLMKDVNYYQYKLLECLKNQPRSLSSSSDADRLLRYIEIFLRTKFWQRIRPSVRNFYRICKRLKNLNK